MDTKQKILVTARKLFAQKGFDGTSVRDISRDAQVNVAAINYHFNGKRQLFLSMLRKDQDQIIQKVEEIASVPGEYIDFVTGIFDCFCAEPETISTYYKISMTNDDFGADVLAGYCHFRASILNCIGGRLTGCCGQDFSKHKTDWVSNTLLNQLIFDATSLSVPAIQQGGRDWMLNIDQRRNRIRELAMILKDALCSGKLEAKL